MDGESVTALRQTLTAALADDYRDIEDDDWRSHWLRFALSIPGEREFPDSPEDVESWVDARVAAFSRQLRLRDRFDAALRGGE